MHAVVVRDSGCSWWAARDAVMRSMVVSERQLASLGNSVESLLDRRSRGLAGADGGSWLVMQSRSASGRPFRKASLLVRSRWSAACRWAFLGFGAGRRVQDRAVPAWVSGWPAAGPWECLLEAGACSFRWVPAWAWARAWWALAWWVRAPPWVAALPWAWAGHRPRRRARRRLPGAVRSVETAFVAPERLGWLMLLWTLRVGARFEPTVLAGPWVRGREGAVAGPVAGGRRRSRPGVPGGTGTGLLALSGVFRR